MDNRKGSTQPQVSIYDTHHCTNKDWKKNAFGWWRNHIHYCPFSVLASTTAQSNWLWTITSQTSLAFILIFHLFLCAKLTKEIQKKGTRRIFTLSGTQLFHSCSDWSSETQSVLLTDPLASCIFDDGFPSLLNHKLLDLYSFLAAI